MPKKNTREVIDVSVKKTKDFILNSALISAGVLSLLSIFIVSFSHYPIVKSFEEILHFSADKTLPMLIYGCIALFAIVLGIERSSDKIILIKNLESQTKEMKVLSDATAHISKNHEEMQYNLNFLRARIELKNPADFPGTIEEAIKGHVPYELNYLFKQELNNYTNFLTNAIKFKRVNFEDNDLFSKVYRKWLESNPKSTIYATSSPLKNYYWSTENEPNTRIENAIVDFINNGGRMERVFFLKKEDFNDKDVMSRMNKQLSFGVKVYTSIIQSEVKEKETKFFIVDKDKKMTFRIYINSDTSMRNFGCSVDADYAARFLNEWDTILEQNFTNLYVKA